MTGGGAVPSEGAGLAGFGSSLMLEMAGIQKSYGAVRALRDVNFELRAGEVMALLGENGAGKSTLVKVLAGLVHADSGSIRIAGNPVSLHSPRQSQDAGVAVVQQEHSSVPCLTVAENLFIGSEVVGGLWTKRRLRARAIDLLETVGLSHIDPSTITEQLTVAEVQLLEIARVLAGDAKIMIFDEPTAALSDEAIERVLAVVRRLADQGRSIIYVTHRLPEVFRIADRVTVVRNGQSLEPKSTSELDVGSLITTMLGRELATMFPERNGLSSEIRLALNGITAPGLAESVSLTVRRGEILGLAGQLGSGASEILKSVAGLVAGTSGEMSVDGARVSMAGRRPGIDAGVAYCSSDRKRDGIFANVSILENLSSPWLRSVSKRKVVSPAAERREARRAARMFAIDESRLNTSVGLMSGGNQQRVALGRWVGISPKVLLVEEPTRGVDVGARAEIYKHLRSLCHDGMSIVVASSDTAELFGLCDSIATFYRGRVTANQNHEEWSESSLLREVMHQEGAA